MAHQNKQIDTYINQQSALKYHQQRTLEKVQQFDLPQGPILEIGCASGLMTGALADAFPDRQIEGIDISAELIDIAQKNNADKDNARFMQADLLEFEPDKKYACVVAEGVHSIFEDPIEMILKWLSFVDENGALMVFGLFSPGQMDFKFHYRSLYNDYGWESGFNGMSVETVSKALEKENVNFRFYPFEIDFTLDKTQDPIKTYTQEIDGQTRVVLADVMIVNMYHLVIERK